MDQQEQYEEIEAYLEGALEPDQVREFERLMEEDPELAKEVELHGNLHRVMGPSGVNTFRAILDEEADSLRSSARIRSIGRRRILSIAASVAVIVTAALWIFTSRATTSDALYNQFYQSPSLTLDPSTVRGEGNGAVLQDMVELFSRVNQLNQDGLYEQALKAINDEATAIPEELQDEVLYRKALLYLNLKDPEEAISYLNQITGLQETVRWYKSLALLSLNRLDEIPDLLQPMTQYDNPRRSEARQLLDKLNEVR